MIEPRMYVKKCFADLVVKYGSIFGKDKTMTDKQIIIDGVDVSGCGWYTQGATGMICADWHLSNDCCNNPNCVYKQLKRKEQECEELKATLKVIADRPCLNINDCDGNCLPHCKWNAHKLAQEALKELE